MKWGYDLKYPSCCSDEVGNVFIIKDGLQSGLGLGNGGFDVVPQTRFGI